MEDWKKQFDEKFSGSLALTIIASEIVKPHALRTMIKDFISQVESDVKDKVMTEIAKDVEEVEQMAYERGSKEGWKILNNKCLYDDGKVLAINVVTNMAFEEAAKVVEDDPNGMINSVDIAQSIRELKT